MTSKMAYLAQPIDQAYDRTLWAGEIHKASDHLTRVGYHVYRPARAWRAIPGQMDPRVETVNDNALAQADLLVAFLPTGVPSIGVPMEIARARQLNIPCLVIGGAAPGSFSLHREGITTLETINGLGDAVKQIESLWPDRSPNRGNAIRLVVAPDTPMPNRSYPDDAGIDLTTLENVTIRPGQFVDVRTQVQETELPRGYWGMIVGRSSTLRKHGLHVPTAVIDPGWRGQLYVGVWNLTGQAKTIQAGDRLGQLILVTNHPLPVVPVETVSETDRGTNGFGSTGV